MEIYCEQRRFSSTIVFHSVFTSTAHPKAVMIARAPHRFGRIRLYSVRFVHPLIKERERKIARRCTSAVCSSWPKPHNRAHITRHSMKNMPLFLVFNTTYIKIRLEWVKVAMLFKYVLGAVVTVAQIWFFFFTSAETEAETAQKWRHFSHR